MPEARINPAASLPINLPKPAKAQGTVAGESMDPNMPLAPLNSNEKPSFNQMLARSNGQSESPIVTSEHDGSSKDGELAPEGLSAVSVTSPSEAGIETNLLDAANVSESSNREEVSSERVAIARPAVDIEAQKAWVEGATLDRQSLATESGASVDVADVELTAISAMAEAKLGAEGAKSEALVSAGPAAVSEVKIGDSQVAKDSLGGQALQAKSNELNWGEQKPLTTKDLGLEANVVNVPQASASQVEVGEAIRPDTIVSEASKPTESQFGDEAQTDAVESFGETVLTKTIAPATATAP